MNLPRISLTVVVSISFFYFCTAQTINEESNWYREIGKRDDYYSSFDFRRYTKSDVESAKAKHLRITKTATDDEWAGTYRWPTMLGNAEITWDGKTDFVYTYVYHTLASLDYGDAISTTDSISFVSEKPTARKVNRFLYKEHVRVKFGEKHFLVPKTRLRDFAVWAVGSDGMTNESRRDD